VDSDRRERTGSNEKLSWKELVAHTGLEPVISALRGQRVNQLHQCAVVEIDYRYRAIAFASLA
jgi:hypothetical protein